MLKLAFDVSPLNTGHKTRGIGSYTQNLLNELKKNPELEIQEFIDLKEVKTADVVHLPYFDLFKHTLPIKKRFPFVVTIHDVTPLIFPDNYPKGIKGSFNYEFQKLALKNVSAVITDSVASKKDIATFLKLSLDKIYSIYLAPSPEFKIIKDKEYLSSIKQKYQLPDEFVLYTGNVNWNKNLLNIAQACKKADISLVLVGSGFDQKQNLNHPELRSFKEFINLYENDPMIKMIGYIDKEDLVGIMNLASMLMLVSFYEGFGLPILEAQACGVPVITSNVSSMPEVLGEGGMLVDPYNVEEIADAMIRVLDKDLRFKIQDLGLDNVKRFSWEKCAKETLIVYESVIKK